jgi:hypothetical protein
MRSSERGRENHYKVCVCLCDREKEGAHTLPIIYFTCLSSSSETYCRRVTTTQSYMIVNQDVAAVRTSFLPLEPEERRNFVHPSVKTETQVHTPPFRACKHNTIQHAAP